MEPLSRHMEEKLTAAMALSGAPVAADLAGARDVQQVRARIADACAVAPEEVELLQGGQKISDDAPLVYEPISVVLKGGFMGRYQGVASYLYQFGPLSCELPKTFTFELTGEGMVVNGICGDMDHDGETYTVRFPQPVNLGEFCEGSFWGAQYLDYVVTGCEFKLESEGQRGKALTGKLHHPPGQAPSLHNPGYQGFLSGWRKARCSR